MNPPRQQNSFVGAQYVAPQLPGIPLIQFLHLSGGLLILSMLVAPSLLGDCKCSRLDKGETTHWGGNQMVVVVEEKNHRKMQRTIEMYDSRPVKNALVEIFDHPEYLLGQSSSSMRDHPEQKRLAACRTRADGNFCFRDLPSGKYELRSSISSGWDVTHVYVVLDSKAGQNKSLVVLMEVGT